MIEWRENCKKKKEKKMQSWMLFYAFICKNTNFTADAIIPQHQLDHKMAAVWLKAHLST